MINKTLSEHVILVIKGFCMGAADVVPGVSGGTMALILGIYTRLINAIRSLDFRWLVSLFRLDVKTFVSRPHFTFLIPLVIGIVLALFFFTRIVPLPELIRVHPEPVYGLFFGLVTGTIIILFHDLQEPDVLTVFVLIGGVVAGLYVFNLIPVNTPEAAWFIFLAGALAICAMILPGVSGSFILLILKKYAYIFHAIGHLQFSVLVPFALGAVTGLVLFSRFLSWLLAHFYQPTLLAINGLLIASLWVIWPFQDRVYETIRGEEELTGSRPFMPAPETEGLWFAVAMMIIGVVSVLFIHRLAGSMVNNRTGHNGR